MEHVLLGSVWGLAIGAGLGITATLWWSRRSLSRERQAAEGAMHKELTQLEQTRYAWEQFASHAILLIPILTRQITFVIEQTEQAASDLITKIRSISERAQKQAAYAGSSSRGMEPLQDVRNEAEALSADVSRIVMAMQFQDMTKQKLEHVAQPLIQMKTYMESLVANPTAPDLAKALNLLEEVERSYTMETERTAHRHAMEGREHVGIPGPSAAEEEDQNVTLF
ncbi:MAG: protein phosphatase CheZ [Nitrospirae bacterium]|nr:protein phosphatase CheZ [Nitrospirota bacterium]